MNAKMFRPRRLPILRDPRELRGLDAVPYHV